MEMMQRIEIEHPRCPHCGSMEIRKSGLLWLQTRRVLKQRYQCKNCKTRFVKKDKEKRTIKVPKKAGVVSKTKIREAVKKVKREREFRIETTKTLLYIKYINEVDDILHLDISPFYKVILIKERIKDLREDKRFD